MIEVEGIPPRDLILVLEPAGDLARAQRRPPLRLVISADADAPRLFLQARRGARHVGPLGPFFRRAAEELRGAKLARIEQVAGDRIVTSLEKEGVKAGAKVTPDDKTKAK